MNNTLKTAGMAAATFVATTFGGCKKDVEPAPQSKHDVYEHADLQMSQDFTEKRINQVTVLETGKSRRISVFGTSASDATGRVEINGLEFNEDGQKSVFSANPHVKTWIDITNVDADKFVVTHPDGRTVTVGELDKFSIDVHNEQNVAEFTKAGKELLAQKYVQERIATANAQKYTN